jgi:aryl-alcohol dehydrogenase-like predicted oxidoreductase
VALAAVLAQPWADVVLSGASTVAQLRSNLEAPVLVPALDLDALAALAQPPAEYWQRRTALPWN